MHLLIAWNERDRLWLSPVDRNVVSVEIRPVARVSDWIEAASETGDVSVPLLDDN